jgi:CBS domain containing-hemolysin-like protein
MVLSTVLVLQFGEIIPKTFAINNPEKFARFAAYPLNIFSIVVSPVQRLITLLSTYSVTVLGGKKHSPEASVTEEEIKTLVDLGEEVGELPANEKEMIHSVFGFADKSVSEVMTPRTDIFYLDVEESIDSIMGKIANSYYSRIPVFEDNIDNIVGILYSKDLLPYTDPSKKRPGLVDLLQTPFMIPETKKINDLLKDFQKKNVHIAIVLDEHAGVSGLVTLDDLMQEIFGDIESKKEIVVLEEGKYRIFGKMPIEEFNEEIGSKIPCEEFDTVGGYIFHAIGRVPKRGETVEHENLQFTVEKMKGPRIISLRLQKKPSSTQNGSVGQ